MKVAILSAGVTPYVLGGIQKHSSLLIKGLLEMGLQVHVYHSVFSDQKPVSNQELIESLQVQQFAKQVSSTCFFFPAGLRFPGHYVYRSIQFSKLLHRAIESSGEFYDFVYAQGYTGYAFLNGCKGVNKLVVNFHGLEMFQRQISFKEGLKSKLLRIPFKAFIQKADYWASLGGGMTSLHHKIGVNPHQVIENPSGIELKWARKSYKPSTSTRKFVFVGRYERRKGVEEIGEALDKLALLDLDFEVHFVGPIPEDKRSKLKFVHYHGRIMDELKLMKILDEMDVLLCPSYSEGLPNVIMEAMARGLSIITTDVGAISIIVDDENGRFVQPGNVNELVEAIQAATRLPDSQLDAMKYHSIEKIKDFIWPKPAQQLIKEFKRLQEVEG